VNNRAKRVHIFLTGGLGNQLFQLAAALHLSENGKVFVYDKIGRPRVNAIQRPEIESLKLPDNVFIKSIRFNLFISKVVGFNLRSGFNPSNLEAKGRKLITFISALICSIFLKRPLNLVKSQSLGFDPKIFPLRRNSILVGYFQTHEHIDSIDLQNFVNFPPSPNEKIRSYIELALEEKPLILHVRLGDYVQEEDIGILHSSYYENCLKLAWDNQRYKKIWLFSDQPIQAEEKIPANYKRFVRVIDSTGLSSAETLELLTLGDGYIIANSTFSWWGAYLRKNQSADVYTPQPWFKNLSEPQNIVPHEWKRVKGFEALE
jgi:hypothetical protein